MLKVILLSFIFATQLFAQETIETVETVAGVKGTGYLGWKFLENKITAKREPPMAGPSTMPASFDWRLAGVMSPIKDQRSCGSCWAFGFTASLESVAAIFGDKAGLDLSEQELVSCDYNALGCSGGYMESASYVVEKGQGLEKDFPYIARGSARCRKIDNAVKPQSYTLLGTSRRSPTIDEMKQALIEHGPLFVTVAAGGSGWSGATGEVKGCRNRGTNHIVNIVGYTEDGKWIMRNSWGDTWGDKGYSLIKFGCDKIGEEAGYFSL